MNNREILILLFSSFFFLSCKEKSNKTFDIIDENKRKSSSIGEYTFYSQPAFLEGFKVELNVESNEIIFYKGYDYFFADSLNVSFFRIIDSLDANKVENLLPQATKIKAIDFNQSDFDSLKSKFDKLYRIPSVEDEFNNEGSYFKIINHSEKKNVDAYISNPLEERELYADSFDLLLKIFKNNTLIEESIYNSRKNFKDEILQVRSENPLYIKLINNPYDCSKLNHEISKLPDSEILYLDVTYFTGRKTKCIEESFRRKYNKIKWITKSPYFLDDVKEK